MDEGTWAEWVIELADTSLNVLEDLREYEEFQLLPLDIRERIILLYHELDICLNK